MEFPGLTMGQWGLAMGTVVWHKNHYNLPSLYVFFVRRQF